MRPADEAREAVRRLRDAATGATTFKSRPLALFVEGRALDPATPAGGAAEPLLAASTFLAPLAGSLPLSDLLTAASAAAARHDLLLDLRVPFPAPPPLPWSDLLARTARITFVVDGPVASVYDDAETLAAASTALGALVLAAAPLAVRLGARVPLASPGDAEIVAVFIAHMAALGVQEFRVVPPADVAVPEETITALVASARDAAVTVSFPGRFLAAFGPAAPRLTRSSTLAEIQRRLIDDLPDVCPMMLTSLTLSESGDVHPCVLRPPALRLGALSDGPEALWNGRALQSLRRSFFEADPPPDCAACPLRARLRPPLRVIGRGLAPPRGAPAA